MRGLARLWLKVTGGEKKPHMLPPVPPSRGGQVWDEGGEMGVRVRMRGCLYLRV